MHRHNNAQHSVNAPPVSARPGESYCFPEGPVLDIERVVAEILRAPHRFVWREVGLSTLSDQIRGRTKLNFHYVATMERERARRPLLLGERDDGGLLLLDGRHRAARSLQLGYETSYAWILTPRQMEECHR